MAKRPNVVFVLTDDQGYGDLRCMGNPVIQTPNLDRFHAECTTLTNFHVGPTCAPTRAGLMTGHYANSTGVWHTIGGRSLLRRNEWSLATALREGGYRTGIFGKWHLGDASPYRPEDRGFETAVVHGGGGVSQVPDWWGNDYFDDTYLVNGEPKQFEGYCTDVWFAEAMRWIKEHRDEPFFCYIPTNAPHGPYNVPQPYYEMYKGRVPDSRARFYGMITNIDENFARLRRHLAELGIEQDTILIFMTDNGTSGGASLDRNAFVVDGYNAGLRGVKGSPYDGGHRVPFMIRWPAGGLDGAREIERLAANVDFMPTLLDLCAVEVPEGRSFHGRSLRPLLEGGGRWNERTVVTDSQRLVFPIKWRQSAVMTDRWRLVNGTELYDVTVDRGQKTNIAAEHPDVVERLRKDYEAWWEIVTAQAEEEIPLVIGREETALTSHDWRGSDPRKKRSEEDLRWGGEENNAVWNQGQVRQGMISNGWWEIEVAEPGTYRFELRRWPRAADRAMTAGIEGDDVEWRRDCIPEGAWPLYTGGTALPLQKARMRVQGREYETDIARGEKAAVFEVELNAGPGHLETWLVDQDGRELGAYYVYVRQQGDKAAGH